MQAAQQSYALDCHQQLTLHHYMACMHAAQQSYVLVGDHQLTLHHCNHRTYAGSSAALCGKLCCTLWPCTILLHWSFPVHQSMSCWQIMALWTCGTPSYSCTQTFVSSLHNSATCEQQLICQEDVGTGRVLMGHGWQNTATQCPDVLVSRSV